MAIKSKQAITQYDRYEVQRAETYRGRSLKTTKTIKRTYYEDTRF